MSDSPLRTGVLDEAAVSELEVRARHLRGAVLTMTSTAGSGHPGGSFSSLELLMAVWGFANVRPEDPVWPDRDRVVVSHGHVSPGVYATLADRGFVRIDDVEAHFRQAGSIFEGHVERSVPGVEWDTGNLGQGLSAGVGFAFASRLTGRGWHTFVAMSDAEQNKGQVGEARRLAAAKGLTDITVLVDLNDAQISGHRHDVLPFDVAAGFRADGWAVVDVDGHDIRAIVAALHEAVAETTRPVAILCHTHIGHGVSFMEGVVEYHGRALTDTEYAAAMAELGLDPDELTRVRARRAAALPDHLARTHVPSRPPLTLDRGTPRTYAAGSTVDCRSAWGSALVDIAEANPDSPIAVLDCDLAPSVKTDGFVRVRPDGFIECGVAEHDAATVAGALSASGVMTYWSDFGMFGIDEVYNQQRLNDINDAQLKLVVTHCGLDVGEDGRTHHCLDYVGAFRSLFGWKVVVPADANQTDRAIRAVTNMSGCVAVAMGRSKIPVITAANGELLFGGGYEFQYGSIEWAREGEELALLVMGTPSVAAVAAADLLAAEGRSVAVGIVSSPLHLDDGAMKRAAATGAILTIEDHAVGSGLGVSVARWLAERAASVQFVMHGIHAYSSSGTAHDLYAAAGLDTAGIVSRARELLVR